MCAALRAWLAHPDSDMELYGESEKGTHDRVKHLKDQLIVAQEDDTFAFQEVAMLAIFDATRQQVSVPGRKGRLRIVQ